MHADVAAQSGREYILLLPKTVPNDGRILVHNNIRPTRRLGREFRVWLQTGRRDQFEVCNCGWAPELGVHHQHRKYGTGTAA
jgi:hypothetical protein